MREEKAMAVGQEEKKRTAVQGTQSTQAAQGSQSVQSAAQPAQYPQGTQPTQTVAPAAQSTQGTQGTAQDTAPAQNQQGTQYPQGTQGAQQTVTPATRTAPSAGRSAAYDKAMAALKQAETKAPTYASSYDEEISEIYDKLTNREPFKYDYSADPLYNQYKESYMQQGKQAMRDSMGQTAALTGGYGSSYGSAVGQQQYDAYLSRLNDVLPELYGQAYDMYAAEGDALRQQYSLAADRQSTEYNQYRDALSDYRYDQALDAERAQQMASDLGSYGDFSGYAELYGEDAAKQMAMTWATANPLPAYLNGTITADQYYEITGEYPRGYKVPGSGGGSALSGGWDPGNKTAISKKLYNYYTGTNYYDLSDYYK